MVVGSGVGGNWTREEKKLDHVENPRRRTRGQLRSGWGRATTEALRGVWGVLGLVRSTSSPQVQGRH